MDYYYVLCCFPDDTRWFPVAVLRGAAHRPCVHPWSQLGWPWEPEWHTYIPLRLVEYESASVKMSVLYVCICILCVFVHSWEYLFPRKLACMCLWPLTSVWTRRRADGWGSLSCRFWFPPALRYTSVGAWRGGHRSHLVSSSRWEWCNVQSSGLYCL